MIRKKNDSIKPLQKIEISITEILITGDGSLKPYIQTFHYAPENIALAPLGSVLGIFEIEDQSEDSAYIVNFLASVAKKEYFSHPKRAAIESLEATLHKINLVLSELIKNDNTAWLGKLNATLCVFEKNNVHFSVSGKAKTLLIRNGILNDISDGLTDEGNIHPLKTFTEVSSGRLKSDDKIILTTPGLFEIFSPEELQKNVRRFSNEKFSQFLKTALVNQLLFGSTLIVDIAEVNAREPALKKAPAIEPISTIPNAFSQSSFSNKKTPTPGDSTVPIPNLSEQIDTIPNESDYTDSKTGHIYVQGGTLQVQPNETWLHIQWVIEDILGKFTDSAKKLSNRCIKSMQDFFEKKAPLAEPERQTGRHVSEEARETEVASSTINSIDSTQELASSSIKPSLVIFLKHARQFISRITLFKSIIRIGAPVLLIFKHFLKKVFPRLGAVRMEFLKLSTKQKKYATAALFFIFIIPFLIIKFQEKPRVTVAPIEEKTPVIVIHPLASDKNIHIIPSTQSVFINNSITTTILLKDTLFAIAKNSIVNLKNPQNTQIFPLPEAFGTSIVRATVMNDLNTIFLLTNTGKIISFTPSNHTFTENAIVLPDSSHISDISTYLTYLYVLDAKSNAIHRYPRSAGGFGDKLPWLKETIEIQDTDTMAINEDLYLTQNDHLLAFNKGRKDPLAFEKSATPIVFSKVFTQTNTQFLYILDAVNGRLIQFEKSGAIVNQYAHEKIKEASTITVDEQAKKAYFTTSSEVFSIGLE